jgi:sensor histidine kinase YesM
VLIPFVENLFKYADITDIGNPAKVQLYVKHGIMEFSTFNKKRKTISFSSPGIGINNIRTRLQSCYDDRFSLQLQDHDSSFSVHLKIIL